MRSHVGGVAVEITRGESAKFNHPLLLVHGLWTGSWIWDGVAAYLAHRGWESWAPSLLAGGALPETHETVVAQLEAVVRALPKAPVIVAHDVGVVAATIVSARVGAPALVSVAPLLPPADSGAGRGLFAWPQFWMPRLGGKRVRPPWGTGGKVFVGEAVGCRRRLVPDSGPIFRAMATGRIRLPAHVDQPGLVVSAERDPISPPATSVTLAARFSWERMLCPGRGHFLLQEAGWEEVVADVHRWLVRTIGRDLLALLEDGETERE